MTRHANIIVMSESAIISAGIATLLAGIKEVSLRVIECDLQGLPDALLTHQAPAVVADPLALPPQRIAPLKAECDWQPRFIAVCASALPLSATQNYDSVVTIYDQPEKLYAAVKKALTEQTPDDASRELSPREKEVVKGIVKGLSNKEIAAEINVSVNTVMTHRRNIASKLQIHSPAGLTIYAIVSKLVKLEDLHDSQFTP